MYKLNQGLEAGIHRGKEHLLWNPEMAPFILGTRKGNDIFNLEDSLIYLRRSLKFLSLVSKKNKVLFLTPRQPSMDYLYKEVKKKATPIMGIDGRWDILTAAAKSCDQPCLTNLHFREATLSSIGAVIAFGGRLPSGWSGQLPVISVLDSSDSPRQVDYPIPGNLTSLSSVYFFYSLFSSVIKESK